VPEFRDEFSAIAMLIIKAYVSYLSLTSLVSNYMSDVILKSFLCVVTALHYNFKDVAVNCCVLYAVGTELLMFFREA
jgi:hypothetical protein